MVELTLPKRRDTVPTSPCAACAVQDRVFCSALDAPELERMGNLAHQISVPGRSTIIEEGEAAEWLFNVTAGIVKLYKLLPDGRQQVTGFLFAGDFLGIALNETYAYSAEAIGAVQLCRFPRVGIEGLLGDLPHLEKRLLTMASNELVQAQDQLLLLGRKTAREKVVSFLLNLSRRAENRGESASPVNVPMSRDAIADYLGLTTETVSRTLTKLKTEGCIRLLAGNQIDLPDMEKLIDMSEGD